MNESEKQFSFTRAALSTGGHPKSNFLSAQLSSMIVHKFSMLISATVILALVLVAGCTSLPPSVKYVPQLPSVKELDGLRVAAELLRDKAKSIEYFSVDIIANGYAVVGVTIINTSSNRSYLVQKENMRLSPGSGGVAAEFRSDAGSSFSTDLVVATVVYGVVLGPLLAQSMRSMVAQDVQHRLVQAELRDGTISPGQSLSGFAYFKVLKGTRLENTVLRVVVRELQTDKSVEVQLPLTQ
jgi:hypothetical protein